VTCPKSWWSGLSQPRWIAESSPGVLPGSPPRDVRSAFFKYLYGRRLAALARALKDHGYDVHDDNAQGAQSAVLPQYLYDEKILEPLVDGLASLAAAEKALSQAQAAHDLQTVDDLWADD